jgi:curved DNA-binding protein CbpA
MNTADAYEILQLSPNAHPAMVTRAFRLLAAMYHPDNDHTGDRASFESVVEAYRLLSDPVRRAAYDRERLVSPHPGADPGARAADGARRHPMSERRLRTLILTALYNTRRNSLGKPGLSLWVLTELTDSTLDEVQFSVWYLRGKKLIESDSDDGVAISVAGVDYIEQNEQLMSDLLSLPERTEVRSVDELPG